jgi:ABC-type multidrug transport system fused ATPase/permease subunit
VEDAKSITTTENGPAAREGILIHVGAGLESDSANAFFVKNATFSYPSSFPNSSLPHSPPLSSSTFSLRSLSLSFPIGRTTLVTGPVAAGKSLLLLGLLGEADMAEGGEVRFPKSSDQPEEPASRRIDESGWLIDSATAFVPQVSSAPAFPVETRTQD